MAEDTDLDVSCILPDSLDAIKDEGPDPLDVKKPKPRETNASISAEPSLPKAAAIGDGEKESSGSSEKSAKDTSPSSSGDVETSGEKGEKGASASSDVVSAGTASTSNSTEVSSPSTVKAGNVTTAPKVPADKPKKKNRGKSPRRDKSPRRSNAPSSPGKQTKSLAKTVGAEPPLSPGKRTQRNKVNKVGGEDQSVRSRMKKIGTPRKNNNKRRLNVADLVEKGSKSLTSLSLDNSKHNDGGGDDVKSLGSASGSKEESIKPSQPAAATARVISDGSSGSDSKQHDSSRAAAPAAAPSPPQGTFRGNTSRSGALDLNRSMASTNDWDEAYGDMNDSGNRSMQFPPQAEEDDDALTWRLDPQESLSDWTIRITDKDDKSVKEFHVHKNMLAVGGRKSEYFATIFKAAAKKPDAPSSTDISMGTAAIKAVPALLDFLYTNRPLVVNGENAVGLRYLSRKFGVKKAFEIVMDFIQRDFTIDKVPHYYRDSFNLNDEKMIGTAAILCGRHIMSIDKSSEILTVADPGFLSKTISSPGIDTDEKRKHVSVLVAAYCKIHKEKVNAETFLRLTGEDKLPLIHKDAVLPLLDVEADLISTTHLTTMTSLQTRCLRDISGHWHELSETDPREMTRVCRKLPSFLVAELLGKSLVAAPSPAPASPAQFNPAQLVPAPGAWAGAPGTKSAGTDELKRKHQKELAQVRNNYEAKVKALEEALAKKETEIEQYQKELLCFERLPNTPDGKLGGSGLMKGHPTQMPNLVDYEKEGYMLSAKKGNQRYPLFFYKCSD